MDQDENVFEFKDHLGSVRARAYWNGEELVTDQWRDYYPYGLQMDGNKEGKDTRFGYQGDFSEEDGETNFNFFEARVFDPVIGRWMAVDPARQYRSGYVGMGNNPVNGVDPNGEEWYKNLQTGEERWFLGVSGDLDGWESLGFVDGLDHGLDAMTLPGIVIAPGYNAHEADAKLAFNDHIRQGQNDFLRASLKITADATGKMGGYTTAAGMGIGVFCLPLGATVIGVGQVLSRTGTLLTIIDGSLDWGNRKGEVVVNTAFFIISNGNSEISNKFGKAVFQNKNTMITVDNVVTTSQEAMSQVFNNGLGFKR